MWSGFTSTLSVINFSHRRQVLNPKKKGKKKKYINSGTVSTPTLSIPACHSLSVCVLIDCFILYSTNNLAMSHICFFFSDPVIQLHLFVILSFSDTRLPFPHICLLLLCVCVCLSGNAAVLQSGVWVHLRGFHPRRVSGMIISSVLVFSFLVVSSVLSPRKDYCYSFFLKIQNLYCSRELNPVLMRQCLIYGALVKGIKRKRNFLTKDKKKSRNLITCLDENQIDMQWQQCTTEVKTSLILGHIGVQ